MKYYHFSKKMYRVGCVLKDPWVIIGSEYEVRKKPYVETDYNGEYVWMHFLGDESNNRIEPDIQFKEWGKIIGESTVIKVERVRNPLLDMENPDNYCPWK